MQHCKQLPASNLLSGNSHRQQSQSSAMQLQELVSDLHLQAFTFPLWAQQQQTLNTDLYA